MIARALAKKVDRRIFFFINFYFIILLTSLKPKWRFVFIVFSYDSQLCCNPLIFPWASYLPFSPPPFPPSLSLPLSSLFPFSPCPLDDISSEAAKKSWYSCLANWKLATLKQWYMLGVFPQLECEDWNKFEWYFRNLFPSLPLYLPARFFIYCNYWLQLPNEALWWPSGGGMGGHVLTKAVRSLVLVAQLGHLGPH